MHNLCTITLSPLLWYGVLSMTGLVLLSRPGASRLPREAAVPAGAHRATGWGGAALLVLGLDTRRRTG